MATKEAVHPSIGIPRYCTRLDRGARGLLASASLAFYVSTFFGASHALPATIENRTSFTAEGVFPLSSLDVEHISLVVVQPFGERTHYYIHVPLIDAKPHSIIAWKVNTFADASQAMEFLRQKRFKAVKIQISQPGRAKKCEDIDGESTKERREEETLQFLDCQLEPYSGRSPKEPCELCNLVELIF